MSTPAPTKKKAAERHVVARAADLAVDDKLVVTVKGREIAIINDQGRLHALRNVCPHHGAPLCAGKVAGFMQLSEPHTYDYSGDDPENRVVLCPWHGYKFRLADGRSVSDPDLMGVRTYRVEVEGDDLVLYV